LCTVDNQEYKTTTLKIEITKRTSIKIIVYLTVGLLFSFQYSKVDSIKNALTQGPADTTSVNALNAMAWELQVVNLDTAILLSTKALQRAKSIAFGEGEQVGSAKWQKGIGNSHRNLGVFYYRKRNDKLALRHYQRALAIFEKLHDKKGLAVTLFDIGRVYSAKDNYPPALKYFFQALEINRELGHQTDIARNLGHIGSVYLGGGEYAKALEYYSDALKINKESGNKRGMVAWINNIGLVYADQGDYPRALEYYFRALKINKEIERKEGVAVNLSNIGEIYEYQGNYGAAMKHYFHALKIDSEIAHKRGIANNLGSIGALYTRIGRFKEAEQYLDSALALSWRIGEMKEYMGFERSIVKLYDTTARYSLAYEHHKKYTAAKDSLFNEEKSKEIGKLEAKHEFEMAEMKRNQEEAEQARILAAQIHRRNNLQYSAILIGLFLLFGLTFFLGRFTLPNWTVELATFIPFLILFETCLVYTDPYVDQWTGGEPAWKLLINAGLAAFIFPLHGFFEAKLKQGVFKTRQRKIENKHKTVDT